MPSTYTTNLGLEKIADGEQTGTWGGTQNINFDLIDESVNGIITITLPSAGTDIAPNILLIKDGETSDGRNAHVEYVDGGDLGADAYVQLDPSDAEKLVFFKNSLTNGRDLHVFQGTHDSGREYIVNNGNTTLVGFNGQGASASVAISIYQSLQVDGLALPNATSINWTNAAADDTVSIEVDANDDWIFTTNSTVVLQYDLSGTNWDFQANDITTTGAVNGASVATTGNVAATGTVTGSNLSGTNTGDEVQADESTVGIVEIATQAEVNTGSDTLRVVTPDTLSNYSGLQILTTKGDIFCYDTAQTRLAGSGTDEYVLTYDSAQPTGLKWAPPANEPQRVWNKAVTIELPTSADDVTVFFTQEAITVTEIRSVAIGTTPSVQWSMYHGLSRASGNLIVQVTTTSETTGDDTTSFTDATIPADSFVWIEVDAVTGTSNQVSATMIGTVDL